jgi:DNA replication licensing factor MCM6
MIRLSEAIAKVNCVEDISPEMVIEAYNLLRQSIISVEHEDVEVDEEETQDSSEALRQAADLASGRDREGDSSMGGEQNGDNATADRQRNKHTITYDTYISMVNLFVHRIHEDESGSGDGVPGDELIAWFLEQKEDEMDGEEDYHKHKSLANMVLKKMVKVSAVNLAFDCETCTYTHDTGQHPHGTARRGVLRRHCRTRQFGSCFQHCLRPAPQLCGGGVLSLSQQLC